MNEIFLETIPLSDLIQSSPIILVITPQGSDHHHISIAPDGKEDPDKYPPFIKTVYHFKVLEILKNEPCIDIPKTITVPEANWDIELGQHELQYLEDMTESPCIEAYSSSIDNIEQAGIIFLQDELTDDGAAGFEFAMESAYESAAMKDNVMAIINEQQPE